MQNQPQGRHIHVRMTLSAKTNKQNKNALELAGARLRNAMHANIWGRRSKEYFLTQSAPLKFAQRQLRNKARMRLDAKRLQLAATRVSIINDYSRVACVAIGDIRHDRSQCETVTKLSLYVCNLHWNLSVAVRSTGCAARFCQKVPRFDSSVGPIVKKTPQQFCQNLKYLRFEQISNI